MSIVEAVEKWTFEDFVEDMRTIAEGGMYYEIPPDYAQMFLKRIDERLSRLPSTTDIAAATAHRACHNQEHDALNGKLAGYCIVCGVPWPCETAQVFLRKKQS